MLSQTPNSKQSRAGDDVILYVDFLPKQQSKEYITFTQVMNNAAWNKFTVRTQLTKHHSLMSS